MKKTTVNVLFDEEKLSAARLYMEQKELSFEDEMSKAADALYGKYVPANVREFLEMSADSQPAAKPKRTQSVSSAVGAAPVADGDAD